MGYLLGLGFKLFRLRESKENEEFLLYDVNKSIFNQYSEKRAFKVFLDECKDKDINIYKFVREALKFDDLKASKCEEWLRNEVFFNELKLIDNLGYKPSDELIFTEDDKLLFNMYKKSSLLKTFKHNTSFDFQNIEKLIYNLVGNNKNEYNYFISWIAWQLQNPLKRLPTSIILQGEHGTGKTKFCELVLKPIFERNFCEIGQADINKEYNDFILGKQLIIANEVIHNDNKFLVPDKLKNYVTDEYLSINRKFKDTLYSRNYSQWIFVTNNQVPLKIERGDRRYSVFRSKKLKKGQELINNIINNHDKEINNFLSYLFSLDIDFSYVSHPIENEAKKDILNASSNSIEQFISSAEDIGGFDKLNTLMEEEDDFYKNVLQPHVNSVGIYFISNNLYICYKAFCVDNGLMPFGKNNFTRHLKFIGFESEVGWHEGKTKRLTYIKKEILEEEEEQDEQD